jgi:tRNA(Ile2) C34 agmatinyltransferase TiaS
MKATWGSNVCLYCGGDLKRKGPLYVCKECGEEWLPEKVGFTTDMSSNPYRGDKPVKQRNVF